MRRREFIALLGATTVYVPQGYAQGRIPVIGYLVPRSREESPHLKAAFDRGLNEMGFAEGRNLTIEYRFGNNQLDRMPALAVELAGRNPAVIAAFSTVAARAAQAATTTIPIVFLTGDDPVSAGLVKRFDRPDTNLTGVSFISASLGAKRLELIRSLVPKAERIALLVDPGSPESLAMTQDVQAAAKVVGQQINLFNVGTDSDIEATFAALLDQKIGAYLLTGSPFTNSRAQQFALKAARLGIPGLYTNRDIVAVGGLISYGTSLTDAYRQAAVYVARIIRGEGPADLPVVLPTKFQLAINLNAAKALGIEIPPMLLALADEVIE